MVDAMGQKGQEACIEQASKDAMSEFRGIGNSETARRNGRSFFERLLDGSDGGFLPHLIHCVHQLVCELKGWLAGSASA
jgi:hypothetical protein